MALRELISQKFGSERVNQSTILILVTVPSHQKTSLPLMMKLPGHYGKFQKKWSDSDEIGAAVILITAGKSMPKVLSIYVYCNIY